MNQKKYYSQVGQDRFLDKRIFKGFQGGIFLDLGAFDGITFSNTYFFEKELNWKGYCFEPIPKYYQKLTANRKCKNYNFGIGNKNESVNFKIFLDDPMLSGISENLDENELKNKKFEEIKIKIKDIKQFLIENKIKEIHLLNLDIEGNEEKVLRDINFEKTLIHTICVEDNNNEKKVDKILKQKGFVLIKHYGFDKIFINKKGKFYSKKLFLKIFFAWIINVFYTRKIQKIFRTKLERFPRMKKILKKILLGK